MLVMTIRGNAFSMNITGDLNVATSRQRWQQVELLENETDFLPSNSGEFGCAGLRFA